MGRTGFWQRCTVVLLAFLGLVLAESSSEPAEPQTQKSKRKTDGYGNVILAEYPMLSGGNMRVLSLPQGARAVSFGENDFQTMSSQFAVENDAEFDDIGESDGLRTNRNTWDGT